MFFPKTLSKIEILRRSNKYACSTLPKEKNWPFREQLSDSVSRLPVLWTDDHCPVLYTGPPVWKMFYNYPYIPEPVMAAGIARDDLDPRHPVLTPEIDLYPAEELCVDVYGVPEVLVAVVDGDDAIDGPVGGVGGEAGVVGAGGGGEGGGGQGDEQVGWNGFRF